MKRAQKSRPATPGGCVNTGERLFRRRGGQSDLAVRDQQVPTSAVLAVGVIRIIDQGHSIRRYESRDFFRSDRAFYIGIFGQLRIGEIGSDQLQLAEIFISVISLLAIHIGDHDAEVVIADLERIGRSGEGILFRSGADCKSGTR